MESKFYGQVYRLVAKVPPGKVTTYKMLAEALSTKAYREVGRALKMNPYAPRVPCHRVVASSGLIGGFMGKASGLSVKRKKEMLQKEGIEFTGLKIKNFDRVLYKYK